MKSLNLLILALSAMLIGACAKPAPPPPQYIYKADAIRINVKTDHDLNRYQNQAHTLLTCVYQLRDPNSFNQLRRHNEGLNQLLSCQRFDSSVTSTERLIIRPDQDISFTLDRAEGTKYVGIVAGYYAMRADDMVRLLEVPVLIDVTGLFTKTVKTVVGDMVIDLGLGSQQINSCESNKKL